MDILNYGKAKARGTVKVERYGDSVGLQIAKFDPETGERLPPEMAVYSREQLQKERDTIQARLDAIDALLADVDEVLAVREK